MNIGVVGVGYVGLVTALGFAEMGHDVVAMDTNTRKIDQLRRGISPIYEERVADLLRRWSSRTLRFTTNLKEAARNSDVVFLCVGTPTSANGRADLSSVFAVVKGIVPFLRRRAVIAEKSTVPVGTCDAIRAMLLNAGVPPAQCNVACNPEFLREGSALRDFLQPDRIVLGSDDDFAKELLRRIYEPLIGTRSSTAVPGADYRGPEVFEMSSRSAELVKHASNAFLAMKISYINAIANIAESTGADIDDIASAIGADPRIGRDFLRPGIGYGGSCFPKDVEELRRISERNGYCFDLLNEVQRINAAQRHHILHKLELHAGSLKGKKIAVLGLSFKAGTDDVRCSPALDVLRLLLNRGASVCAFDPAATQRARELLGDAVTFAGDAYMCLAGADAALILTDWPEFACLDLHRVRMLLHSPLIVDGRNLYRPEEMAAARLTYLSVGRDSVAGRRPGTRPESRLRSAPQVVSSDLDTSVQISHPHHPFTSPVQSLQTSDSSDTET